MSKRNLFSFFIYRSFFAAVIFLIFAAVLSFPAFAVGMNNSFSTGQYGPEFNPCRIPGYLPSICPKPSPRETPEPREEPPLTGIQRVHLEADEVRNVKNVTIAEGNARVDVRNINISADRIEYDNILNEVRAFGHVAIRRGKDLIGGDTLNYNIATSSAFMTNAYGVLLDIAGEAVLQNEVHFQGKEIRLDNSLYIKDGTITTSETQPPDSSFYIKGEEIFVYPKDKIVVKKIKFFRYDKRLLSLNNITFPLGRRIYQPYLPKIGRNSLEGFYVKEKLMYQMGKRDYGLLSLDWFNRAGIGAGIQHFYHLGDRGEGKFEYYNMGSPKTTINRYRIAERFYYNFPGDYFLSTNYTSERYLYPGQTNPPIKNGEIYFRHFTDRSKYALLLRDYKQGDDRNKGFNFFHRYFHNDHLRSDIVLDYLSSETPQNKRYRLNTLARLVNEGDIFDSWLEFENTSGNRSFYVNRLPEASLRSHSFKMGPFNAKTSLSVGNFIEMPSDTKSLRADLKFSLLNSIFHIGDSTDFSIAGGARQFLYNDGEKKYLFLSKAALEQRLGKNLSLVVSHNYQDTNGYSPLAMDYYDKYNIVATTLQLHSMDKYRLQVTGGYDLDKKLYQTIIPRLEICPSKKFKMLIGSTYDRNNRLWMNMDGELGIKLSKNLTFKYWGLYDLVNKKMTYQNYIAELDSRDFLTRLVYKGSQGELWLDLTMKILPYEEYEAGANPNKPVIDKHMFDGAPEDNHL